MNVTFITSSYAAFEVHVISFTRLVFKLIETLFLVSCILYNCFASKLIKTLFLVSSLRLSSSPEMLVLDLPTPEGCKDESSAKVP